MQFVANLGGWGALQSGFPVLQTCRRLGNLNVPWSHVSVLLNCFLSLCFRKDQFLHSLFYSLSLCLSVSLSLYLDSIFLQQKLTPFKNLTSLTDKITVKFAIKILPELSSSSLNATTQDTIQPITPVWFSDCSLYSMPFKIEKKICQVILSCKQVCSEIVKYVMRSTVKFLPGTGTTGSKLSDLHYWVQEGDNLEPCKLTGL